MSFVIAEPVLDIETELREVDGRKSAVTLKPLLTQAADEIQDLRKQLTDMKHFMHNCATELDEVSRLRVGFMDSQSRADEVARQVKQTMVNIISSIRCLP